MSGKRIIVIIALFIVVSLGISVTLFHSNSTKKSEQKLKNKSETVSVTSADIETDKKAITTATTKSDKSTTNTDINNVVTTLEPQTTIQEKPQEEEENDIFAETVKEVNFTGSSENFDSLEISMLDAVNLERSKSSKNNVSMSALLNDCAKIRAKEIAQSFSHTRPDGRTCNTVLSDGGISFKNWGENVAKGQTSVADVMSDWMNSPGHRSNILSEQYDYTKFGFAAETVDGITYWVQIFISE